MNNATSYSDLAAAQRCLNKYKYREHYRIQSKKRAVTLHEGSLQHGMLQEAYIAIQHNLDPIEAAIAWANTQGDKRYLFDDELADQQAMIDVALARTEHYFTYYHDHSWEILHVEEQFISVLEDGTIISCTPDLVVKDRDSGAVFIYDHKTYASIPDYSRVDLQSIISLASVRAIYPEAAAFVYNFLRKKLPTQPTLVKSGKNVARINDVDTTFELLRDFVIFEAPHLMDDDMHRRRLAELKGTNRFFRRNTIYLDDTQLAHAMQDVSDQVKVLQFVDENQLFPRSVVSGGFLGCERCEFVQICQAEMVDSDTQRVLEEFYEPRDDSHKQYDEED